MLGDGPLYPIADYFGGDAVLELRDDEREPDGSYEKKVRWLGAGYAGPVLLRAARIDGPGAASARFSYVGNSRDGGHYAVLTNAESDLPATTTVDGPGLQLLVFGRSLAPGGVLWCPPQRRRVEPEKVSYR